jgi:hypothetical protein
MGKLNLSTLNRKRVSIAMMAVCGVMATDSVYQVGRHVQWRRWITSISTATAAPTSQPTTQPASQPAQSQPATQAASRPAVERPRPRGGPAKAPVADIHPILKKRNIFTEPPVKGHGMRLTGVIGRTALFATRDGKTVGIEEGQSGQGIKVKSIKEYEVVIEYDGKPETMKLFQ